MDNKNIYIQRLAIYAQCISKIDLKTHPKRGQYQYVQICELKEGEAVYYEMKTHAVLLDFHLWFPEDFYWNEKVRAAILRGMDPEVNPVGYIVDFLGFRNSIEILHILSIGLQSPGLFGGSFVLEDSGIQVISQNVSHFIRYKISENTAS